MVSCRVAARDDKQEGEMYNTLVGCNLDDHTKQNGEQAFRSPCVIYDVNCNIMEQQPQPVNSFVQLPPRFIFTIFLLLPR